MLCYSVLVHVLGLCRGFSGILEFLIILELLEFFRHIEARALFNPLFRFYLTVSVQVRREVAVSAHPAAGESLLQLPDEQPERGALCRSPGICRTSPAVQTAFIADTYRVSVEAFTCAPMRSRGRVRCNVPSLRM